MKTIMGTGNTADVYEWDDGKVLKLFHTGYPKELVEKEFQNALTINKMDFGKPKVYETIYYEEHWGILYERAEGESLLDQVLRTGDLLNCALQMAVLHKKILQNKISDLPDYKQFLRYNIENMPLTYTDKKEEALRILDNLPDGDILCHGDYHPGNIIVSNETAKVIDFMNLCRGNYLYDVARAVYLVEYTPVPEAAEDKDAVLLFKKALADLYLSQMSVTREMIKDYLFVIAAARIKECPGEKITFFK